MIHWAISIICTLGLALCLIDMANEIREPFGTDHKDGITATMVRHTVTFWTGLGIHVAAIGLMAAVISQALPRAL